MAVTPNPKQRAFIAEYLKDRNATQAALRAGYSFKTAYSIGGKLLKKLKPFIAERLKKIEDKCEVEATDIILGLKRIADLDLSSVYDDNGRLLPVKQWPEDAKRAFTGIKVFEEFDWVVGSDGKKERVKIGETVEVKTEGRQAAWTTLAKIKKMMVDKVEVELKIGIADRINKAWVKLQEKKQTQTPS